MIQTPNDTERLVAATERIADALEQLALARLDPYPANLEPAEEQGPVFAQLPPVRPVVLANAGVCPIHNQPWKIVPAGISKKTGNAYQSFAACPTSGCDQRPPR